MADSPIGEIPVLITGDYSDLETAIQSATQAADQGASAIAHAFDVPDLAAGAAASLNALGDAAQQASGDLTHLGTSAGTSSGELNAVQSDASGAVSALGDLGDAGTHAAGGLDQAGSSASEAGTHATEAEGGFAGLAEELLKVGVGFASFEALKEFATDAISAYATVQSVTIGLTQLTGSAQTADTVITQIKQLADTEPFAFPEIAPTVQKMVALGVAASQIPGVMQAIADSSAATGNAFNQVANSFDRMALSGTVNARALVQLGISTQDLANVMGVASNQVKAAFLEMDQSERIDTLQAALEKFAGSAEAQAQGIAGQWQILKNHFEEAMVGIGEALAPAGALLIDFGNAAAKALQGVGNDLLTAEHDVVDFANATGATLGQLFTAFTGITPPAQQAASATQLFYTALTEGNPTVLAASKMFETLKSGIESVTGAMQAYTNTGPQIDAMNALIAKGTAAQTQALKDSAAAMLDMGVKLTSLDTETQSYVDQQKKLIDAVTTARTSVATLTAEQAAGKDVTLALALANQQLEKATAALTPTTKAATESIAGIEQAAAKAQNTFESSLAVYTQLKEGFDNGTVSAAELDQAYTKLESSAKKAGQAIADATGIQVQWNQQIAQTKAVANESTQAFADITRGFIDGSVAVTQFLADYLKWQAAAKGGGDVAVTVEGQIAALTNSVELQEQTLKVNIETWGKLQAASKTSADAMQAVPLAMKTVETEAAALGVTIQQVGQGFEISAKVATPAAQAMVASLTEMMNQAGLTVQTIQNGIPVYTDAATHVQVFGKALDTSSQAMSQIVTLADGTQVTLLKIGQAAATSAGGLKQHADAATQAKQAEADLGTTIINLSSDFGPMVEKIGGLATAHTTAATAAKNHQTALVGLADEMQTVGVRIQGLNGNIATLINGNSNMVISAADVAAGLTGLNITIAANGSKMLDLSRSTADAAAGLQTYRDGLIDAAAKQQAENDALTNYGQIVGTAKGNVDQFTDAITQTSNKTITLSDGAKVLIENLDTLDDTLPTTASDLTSVGDAASGATVRIDDLASAFKSMDAAMQAADSAAAKQYAMGAGAGSFSAGGISNGSTSSLGTYAEDVAAFTGTALSDVFGSSLTKLMNAAGFQQTGNNQFESNAIYNQKIAEQVAAFNAAAGSTAKYLDAVATTTDDFGNTVDHITTVLNTSYVPATAAAAAATGTLATAASSAATSIGSTGSGLVTAANTAALGLAGIVPSTQLITDSQTAASNSLQNLTQQFGDTGDELTTTQDALGNWTYTLKSTGQTVTQQSQVTADQLMNMGLSVSDAQSALQGITAQFGTSTDQFNAWNDVFHANTQWVADANGNMQALSDHLATTAENTDAANLQLAVLAKQAAATAAAIAAAGPSSTANVAQASGPNLPSGPPTGSTNNSATGGQSLQNFVPSAVSGLNRNPPTAPLGWTYEWADFGNGVTGWVLNQTPGNAPAPGVGLTPGTIGSPDQQGYAPAGPGAATIGTGPSARYFTDPQDQPGSPAYIQKLLQFLSPYDLEFLSTGGGTAQVGNSGNFFGATAPFTGAFAGPQGLPPTPSIAMTYSGNTDSNNTQTFNITVQAGTVVGQGGMQQLAAQIQQQVTTLLRQTAGQRLT